MKTWKEFLLEQSQAARGDWVGKNSDEPILRLDSVGENQFNKHYNLTVKAMVISSNKTLDLYKHKTMSQFRLGYWYVDDITNNRRFYVVGYIDLKRAKTVQYKLDIKRVYNVEMVFIDTDFRESHLATLLYNYLITLEDYTILGDKRQYFGARKLWSRLSGQVDVVVDIVDIKSGEVLFRDVILKQGKHDSDFDKRLWTYKDDTHNIRSILRKVI